MSAYVPRLVDDLIRQSLTTMPALFIVGPRATGKTTTAMRHAATVIRLDRDADAVAFRADPDAALRALPSPVLLDEWQAVPGVLGAVKRAVDDLPEPGRFIVTGSARGDLESAIWPGTGRLIRIPIHGFTVRELGGRSTAVPFLDRMSAIDEIRPAPDTPDLRGYVELMLTSGFPEPAIRLSGDDRRRWLESYVDQVVTRDADLVESGRDPARLRRYFEAYALSTAGVVEDRTLYEAAGINRRTALAYESLLTNLLVVDALPAWTSNRLKRLVLGRKRYVVDPALAAALLRLDATTILRSGDLLGRLLDTFVAAQLRAEVVVTRSRPRLYHVRQEQGRLEVDIAAELGGGAIIAIEVKANAAPTSSDARHLVTLRDRLGDAFVAGVLFHTGPRAFSLGDRIIAVPISALWA